MVTNPQHFCNNSDGLQFSLLSQGIFKSDCGNNPTTNDTSDVTISYFSPGNMRVWVEARDKANDLTL
jgi:hypothetical protein